MELADWAVGVSPELDGVLPDPSALPELYTKRRTDFQTAPGFREIGMEYTCIPDPVYPWDPTIMKQIWEYAPDAVPMWVRWVFRSPEEDTNPHDVVFGRHALGRAIKNARSSQIPFRCDMPTMPVQGLHFEQPNSIWFIHEGARPTEKYVDLPGEYLPFDSELLLRVKENARGFKMSDEEYKKYLHDELIDKVRERWEAQAAANREDMDARNRDFDAYAQKIFDSLSDVEIAEFLAGQMVPSVQ